MTDNADGSTTESCAIRDAKWPPLESSLASEDQPKAVKIYALGRFAVLIDDKKLTFARKVPKRPLELLKALIALGGRNVREDVLGDALWPEAEGDAAARALTSTLHRLRKLIGQQTVLRKDGRLTLDPQRCWVDLWLVERRLNELGTKLNQSSASEMARRTEELVSLQRGAFLLGESEQPWVLATRSRIERCFVRLLESFGVRHAEDGRYHLALDCFENALELDPQSERLYRELMRVLVAGRERSQVLAVYERCQRMLATKYGCRPSAATEALIRELRAS